MTSLSLLALAACGDTATPESGTKDESNLTLQQVFDQAIERQQTLKSVHANVEMDQSSEMMFQGQAINMTSSSNLEMDITQDPIAMHTKGTVAMDMMGQENMEIPIEMYMSEKEGFFMFNADSNQWMKLPADQQEQILEQTGAQADASEQLEQLQQFVDEFTFEQDDVDYKLTLNVEGEGFKEFFMTQMGASLADDPANSADILNNMTFEDSKYEIIIAKDTFDTKQIDMDLTIIVDENGQKSKIENKAFIEYSNFDELDSIAIPKEVIKNAIAQ